MLCMSDRMSSSVEMQTALAGWAVHHNIIYCVFYSSTTNYTALLCCECTVHWLYNCTGLTTWLAVASWLSATKFHQQTTRYKH